MTVTQRSSRGSSFAPAAVAASATLCTVKSGSMAGRGPGRWRTGTHRSAAQRRRRPAEPGSRLGMSRSGCRCLGRWPASDPVGLGVLADTLSAADHGVEGDVDQAPVEVDVSEQPMPGAAACSCVRPGGAPGACQRPAEQVVPAVAGRTRRVPGTVRSDQPELPGPADGLAAVSRRQLAVDVLEVRLDGVEGDVHFAGDLRVSQHA